MEHVAVRRRVAAPIETVWRVYTDYPGWSRWAGLGRVTVGRRGATIDNGIGCVRVISTLGFAVHEEIVAFEPPRRLAYRLTRGAVPMRDHLGEVEFDADGDGTLILWKCQFESILPGLGGLARAGISRLFENALTGLETELRRPR